MEVTAWPHRAGGRAVEALWVRGVARTDDTAAGFDPAGLQDGLLIAPDPGSRTPVVVDFEGHSAEPEPVVVVVEMEFDTVDIPRTEALG